MDSKIPVPTDNVFKFYALFSLLVIIVSVGAILYLGKTTNDLVFDTYVQLEALKSAEGPAALSAAKKSMLEQRMQIALENKTFFLNALGCACGLAVFGLAYGFAKWHKDIQPVIDEMARVQLDIAKLQLEKIRRELNAPGNGGMS